MLFGAMNFPIHPVMEELKKIKAMGFDYMELAMDPPMAHYSTIWDIRQELMTALDRYTMKLVCHLPTFVFTADLTDSLRRASLEEMLHSLETAATIGAQKIVLHPSMIMGMGGFVPEKTSRHALKSLSAIVEKAEQYGLRLCFENMFPGYGSFYKPKHFQELFAMFPSLYMTLDIGHAHIHDTQREAIHLTCDTLDWLFRSFQHLSHSNSAFQNSLILRGVAA